MMKGGLSEFVGHLYIELIASLRQTGLIFTNVGC